MKNFIKFLGNGFIFGIGIFASLVIVGVVYATISHVTSGSTLTATTFNQVIDATVPIGGVIAFNSSSCPTGWIIADGTNGTPDLRGEFIRGLDNGRGVDIGRALNSWQTPSLATFAGGVGTNINTFAQNTNNSTYTALSQNFGFDKATSTDYTGSVINQVVTNSYTKLTLTTGGNAAVRPRNVALLYCIKQ